MIEEHENQETSLQDLIDLVERDDLPTNEFTTEDKDPMVILGKLNEVIAYLQTLQATISASDSKANEALQKAIQAIADATQALSVANGIDAKATQALDNAIEAVGSANTALSASNTALSTANTAISTANTALSSANSAVETAESALNTAESAETKADTAITTANEAKTTAEGIDTKATTALANSQTAVSTANTAETKAQEAIEQVIGGLGTKVYRDTELLTSLDIKPIEDDISNNSTAITSLQNGKADISVIPTNADFTLADLKEKSYNSLTDKPTIPTKTSQLTNDSNFATTSQIPTKTSQLTNDSNFATTGNLSSYLPLTGGTLTGHLSLTRGTSIKDSDGNILLSSTTYPYQTDVGNTSQPLRLLGSNMRPTYYGMYNGVEQTPKALALYTDIPDISGKANLSGGNTFSGTQTFNNAVNISGTGKCRNKVLVTYNLGSAQVKIREWGIGRIDYLLGDGKTLRHEYGQAWINDGVTFTNAYSTVLWCTATPDCSGDSQIQRFSINSCSTTKMTFKGGADQIVRWEVWGIIN